jgi:hypothetical protein
MVSDRELLELMTIQVSTLTSIENQIGDKVRTLFDAHSLYLDYFESLKDGQARIEQILSSLSRQEINYEYKLSDYDRELRLIRSEKKNNCENIAICIVY